MELTKNTEKHLSYRKKAEELVSKMTLEDLVLQTLHKAPSVEYLGIPAYNWWNEALHGIARAGVATVFPQAIGLAATFDEDFLEEIADAISTEGRAKFNMQQKYLDSDIYKGLTFWSPNVNIFRDPRWGRGHETYGEDPYLTSRLGVRFVNGLQGHDEHFLKSAACAKHFAVHSGPEDVRHSFDAIATKQDMYETYLPAFKACVQEAKVEAVMGAYNRTNGVPCCGHKELLIDVLRNDWGFKGHVVSDCWAIKDFHEGHFVTKNAVESVSMAMNNGCDLNCGDLFILLQRAVEEGYVKEERLREAVVNLYTTRMKLGVLDNKENNHFDDIPYSVVDSKEMKALNLTAAQKSICLKKKENNLLPLNKSEYKTIGVIGPNANNRKALVGNYEGTASKYTTVLEGLQEFLGDETQILYSQGCHLFKDKIGALCQPHDLDSEVQAVCDASDLVVVVLGLDADLEGEEGDAGNEFSSGDKPNINLPGLQEDILKLAHKSGKPLVLVLLSGSALAVKWADENVPVIIQGWYPGARGGEALAKLIFGEMNFEGKLPITFYNSDDELPGFTDYSMQNRTYRYMKNEALYPFGFGLSYSKFNYTDLSVDYSNLSQNNMKISGKITNESEFDGCETTQVYIKTPNDYGLNYQLKAVKKVSLKANETKSFEITLNPKSFAVYDEEAVLKILKGKFYVSIGSGQPDSRTEMLSNTKVSIYEINNEEEITIKD